MEQMTLEQRRALALASARARTAESEPAQAATEGGFVDGLKNIGMGAIKGASDIGATILSPLDATGITGRTPDERRAALRDFFSQNADPNSMAFKGGAIGAQIAGTAGAGGVLAKGASAIPALAKFAPAIESGGFNLGDAATNSVMKNAFIRALGGAVQGGAQAGLVDPASAGTGAAIGAVIPGAVSAAGYAGDAIRGGLEKGSKRLMQSALKPTIEQLRSGKAATAVDTLLDEGLNATKGGVDKLKGRIGDINDEVSSLISGSTASVDKQKVIDALKGTRQQFTSQVSPTADLAAIDSVAGDFAAHPQLRGNDIPVQLAQELKKGTYKVLSKKYGQLGSAETEAQKALARGLKEGISEAVPEVAGLNAREARLLQTLDVAERRALMDANKNPMGLAILANNPASWAAFMADKSALFKSLAARAVNQVSKVSAPQALPNLMEQHGLLGAPSVMATSSP